MALIQAKQIDKLSSATVVIAGVAALAANTLDITAALATAVATAGNGGTAVANQAATATTSGWVVGTTYEVQVWDSTTKARLTDAIGNEVYAKHAALNTLSFYTLVAGVETAFTMAAGNIDIALPYQFHFGELPSTAGLGARLIYAADDPTGGKARAEALTVTAPNTLSAFTVAPNAASEIVLDINGQDVSSLAVPAPFTVAGTAITWSVINAGFSLATTDSVVARYSV